MLAPLLAHADETISPKTGAANEIEARFDNDIENDSPRGRKLGVEWSLLNFLQPNDKESKRYIGSISYFSQSLNAEIALPFIYSHFRPEVTIGNGYTVQSYALDIHYRKFQHETLNGFYLSSFVRFARLRGRTGQCIAILNCPGPHPYDTEHKVGLGAGIGYRKFFNSGVYWGASLSLGFFVLGESDKFLDYPDNDRGVIIDAEFLKLGYAF